MRKIIIGALLCAVLAGCCRQEPQQEIPAKDQVIVENILARRSVRDYTADPVSQEQLETIMNCAINAPSAMNRQPWEVRVIQDQEILEKMRAINDRAIYNAPVVIIVAGDKNSSWAKFDCGLLTQNIVLAAEAMDIGTVIVGSAIGIFNTEEGAPLLEALDLPEDYQPVMGICLGHKNEWPDARPRDAAKVKYIR